MNSIAQKYNRFLILIFAFAPFVAFITVKFLNMDFNRIMQLLSYIGVFLVLIFRDNNHPIKFPKYLFFYLLFIIYVFYSDLYRLNRPFKIDYLFSNPLIGGFNMMLIIENLVVPKDYYKKLVEISKWILIYAVIVIFIQQVFNQSFFVNERLSSLRLVTNVNVEESRLVSIYSWIGGFITVGFSFVPIFLLTIEELFRKKKNIFLWLLAGLLFSFLSKARWIMVNTLLVFVMLFILDKQKVFFYLRYILVVPLVILSLSIVLEYAGISVTKIAKERILESDKKDISNKSAGTRILAFEVFNKLFWEHPFFGVGSIKYGMGGSGKQDYKLRSLLRGRSSQLHVGYVSLLYMYGIVGGGLFLSFLFFLLIKLKKSANSTGTWAPFFGFLGFILANLTLVSFSVFQMGLILVFVAERYYNNQTLNRKIEKNYI